MPGALDHMKLVQDIEHDLDTAVLTDFQRRSMKEERDFVGGFVLWW